MRVQLGKASALRLMLESEPEAVIFFGLLTVLPFVDRTPLRSLRRRPVAALFGLVLLAAVVALSIMTAVAPVARHLG